MMLSESQLPRFPIMPGPRSGFLLWLQDLTALVHAGFQIEMMRPPQLAGILVFDIGRLLQRVGGAAHAASRRRGFSSRNGHNRIILNRGTAASAGARI